MTKKPYRPYTKKEDKEIVSPRATITELAEKFGRTKGSVRWRRFILRNNGVR